MIAVADATHLPFADESVDLVLGSEPLTLCGRRFSAKRKLYYLLRWCPRPIVYAPWPSVRAKIARIERLRAGAYRRLLKETYTPKLWELFNRPSVLAEILRKRKEHHHESQGNTGTNL